ncbi:hypothetical protein ABZ348_24210 [Streptomyces sp. NPDC005963]|uniref:hypothetical protein n=1 Tax=Streptomyces sp. NPDC005963 TaxID=3156721 RepID=UPI0033E15E67
MRTPFDARTANNDANNDANDTADNAGNTTARGARTDAHPPGDVLATRTAVLPRPRRTVQ